MRAGALGAGVAIGVGAGVALGSFALGVALTVVFATAMSVASSRKG
jgi:hypothetical protein